MANNSDNSSKLDVIFVDLEEDNNDEEIIEVHSPDIHPQQEQPENSQEIDSTANHSQIQSSPPKNSKSTQKKAIQQCLALLLHAQRCDIIQEKTSEVQIECVQPYCSTIKDLLIHLKTCETLRNCSYSRCSSSRMLLRHWDTCKRQDCPLCSPLRRRFNVQTQSEVEKPRNSLRKPMTLTFQSSNSRLLPNPFAELKRTRDFPGDSWDDDPIVEFERISSCPSASVNVQSMNYCPGNPPKPSNFDWVSSTGSQRWRNRRNSGFNKQFKHRNSFKSRGRRGFHKGRGEQGEKTYSRRQSSVVYDDGADKRGNVENEMKCLEFGEVLNTQEQMLMLVHAFKCRRREESGSGGCSNATCKSTKILLEHMKNCENTVRCSIPRCISSKRILIHVNECRDEMCELCSPLRGSITQ